MADICKCEILFENKCAGRELQSKYREIAKLTAQAACRHECASDIYSLCQENDVKGFEVNITFTDEERIRDINREYRSIDRPTDVLSFPMFEKEELVDFIGAEELEYEDILGDMVISIEQVEKQAKEYNHSFKRELSYMVVHSFYHLLGYDHMIDSDKKQMREKEEYVLEKLKIARE